MKQQSKAILGLAVFYIVVVALLDAFLKWIPVINWLALGVAFVFFAVLLLGTVMEFRPRRGQIRDAVKETPHDDLGHLAKTIDRALFQRQPDSLQTLDTRLRSVLASAYISRKGKGEQPPTIQDAPESFQRILRDERIESLLKDDGSMKVLDVERVLSKIEEWLS